jgi:Tfp pilus assembly protein PilE
MKLKTNKGFTIIEVVIIISTIGILVSVALLYISDNNFSNKYNKHYNVNKDKQKMYEKYIGELKLMGYEEDKIIKMYPNEIIKKIKTNNGNINNSSSNCNCTKLYKEIYELRKQLENK